MLGLLFFAALALLFFIVPVLRRSNKVADTGIQFEQNKSLYIAQRADLEANLQALPETEVKQLLQELDREFLATAKQQQRRAVDPSRTLKTCFMLSLVLVSTVSTLLLYQYWGAGNELRVVDLLKISQQQRLTAAEQDELFARLESAQDTFPEQLDWQYYRGRLLAANGQNDKAAKIFRGMLEQLPDEAKGDRATALTLLAQAEFFANGNQASDDIYQLLVEALALEPDQTQARGLAGILAYELTYFSDAVGHWQQLWQVLPAGADSDALADGIRKAATQSAQQGQPLDISWLDRAMIQLQVAISAEARQQLALEQPVFVFAKAATSPIPVAVKRLTVADLPAKIRLTDADVMAPGVQLSQFSEVIISARASASGIANRTEGDWQAVSQRVSPNTDESYSLVINQLVEAQVPSN